MAPYPKETAVKRSRKLPMERRKNSHRILVELKTTRGLNSGMDSENRSSEGENPVPSPIKVDPSVQKILKNLFTKAALKKLGKVTGGTKDSNSEKGTKPDLEVEKDSAGETPSESLKEDGKLAGESCSALNESKLELVSSLEGNLDQEDEVGSDKDKKGGEEGLDVDLEDEIESDNGGKEEEMEIAKQSRAVYSNSLSFDSRSARSESAIDTEEAGYVLCLIAVTSLLKRKFSENKMIIFKGMQAELTLGLKACLPQPIHCEAASKVWKKMKDLVEALIPVLGIEILESDCKKALELIEETEAGDCYGRNFLKTLRRGGFMQYFTDLVIVSSKKFGR